MFINSKGVAMLLAVCISIITTAFLSLIDGVTATALFVVLVLAFSSSYLLIKITLEFLIFKEINQIYNLLEKLRKKDFSFFESNKKTLKEINPLKRINQEIFSYAKIKQNEIDELKQMEVFRREFIADVSHELKTPIFSAQGFIHTLLDGAVEDEEVRYKFLEKAAKSLDGLDLLVQDLLTLSNIEIGEIKMHMDDFNLYDLTKEVLEQLEVKANKKGITIKFAERQSKKVIVNADYQRIYQVMINLLTNAIKYTQEGGNVEVGFTSGKKTVQVYIKDNGSGIPPEHLNRIFERFYRVEKSRSKDKGGSGLGLAIVKHILESHNSKIRVASVVDKGSVFSFKLQKGARVSFEDAKVEVNN
jgi:two-component system, OmpR family, phosphate regulon sensor histidine kinase PhoR